MTGEIYRGNQSRGGAARRLRYYPSCAVFFLVLYQGIIACASPAINKERREMRAISSVAAWPLVELSKALVELDAEEECIHYGAHD